MTSQTIEESDSAIRAQLKMRDLARLCSWLNIVLQHQDRIVALVAVLGSSSCASSWDRHWTALAHAVTRHFMLEEEVLAPAIHATGQRAHVVVADARRSQLRRDLEDLRMPSWEDDGARLWQLRRNLASHFAQEEGWSYKALVRDHDAGVADRLDADCRRRLFDADQ